MSLIDKIMPPREWQVPVFILLGIFFGISGYVFYASNAISYLSDDPKTCVNCHVMNPQYATWNHSSHREWTNCNDCHVPHENAIKKYFFKAKDGSRHAYMFTMRLEPEVIKITKASAEVVQNNCIRCHEHVNENVQTRVSLESAEHGKGKLCWECHREVPHGRVNSLSSAPFATIKPKSDPVPEWIKKEISKK